MQDFTKLERLQRRATKYTLNDFSTDYKSRISQLKLLPLIYILKTSRLLQVLVTSLIM